MGTGISVSAPWHAAHLRARDVPFLVRRVARQMSDTGIHQQLGKLIEANERAREDRRELREDMSKLFDGLSAINSQLAGLQQTSSSTAQVVANLSLQRCGERLESLEIVSERTVDRLADLERTIKGWRDMIGTGWVFVGRVVLAVFASGAFWALVTKGADWLSRHV